MKTILIIASLLGTSTCAKPEEATLAEPCKPLWAFSPPSLQSSFGFAHWHGDTKSMAAAKAQQEAREIDQYDYDSLIELIRCHPRLKAVVNARLQDGKITNKELRDIDTAVDKVQAHDRELEKRATAEKLKAAAQ